MTPYGFEYSRNDLSFGVCVDTHVKSHTYMRVLWGCMVYQTSAAGRSPEESDTSTLPKLFQTSRIQSGLASCIEHRLNSIGQSLKKAFRVILRPDLKEFISTVTARQKEAENSPFVSDLFKQLVGMVRSNLTIPRGLDVLLQADTSEDDHDEQHGQGGLDDFVRCNGSDEADSSDEGDEEEKDDEEKRSDEGALETGVIYIRESDISSVEDGRNVDGQIEELRALAESKGIELISEPIVDEGETGTNFDREGIREVFARAQQGIDYLFVDDLSRLGRSTAETLYFIHYLQISCGVTIMTPRGEVNISQIDDLIQATMRSLVSQLSTRYRTRASLRSRKIGFVEEKNWSSGYATVPPGYKSNGDDWIEVNGEEYEAAETMFDEFLSTKSYSSTAEHLNTEFGDVLDPIEPWQVKKHLQRKVYVGKPTLSIDSEHLDESEFSVDDPALQIVSHKTFDDVQEHIEVIQSRYSTESGTVTPEKAMEMFGLFAVVNSSPVITLQCTEPGCDGELRANGQRELDGDLNSHSYQCKECGRNRKWPYLSELEDMRGKHGVAEESEGDKDSEGMEA